MNLETDALPHGILKEVSDSKVMGVLTLRLTEEDSDESPAQLEWVLLGGSSQDSDTVVNNHGDRKSPKDRVIPLPNGLNGL